MNNKKEKQAKLQIRVSVLVVTVILFAEMYLMINFSQSYLPIIILAVIALVAVYILINALMTWSEVKEAKREEHFENIYRSEKASYIMLKKGFDEIEEHLDMLQEISAIPAEEIINAQKGIAKVIINRSKENTDTIIHSNDHLFEKINEVEEIQNTQFTSLSNEQEAKLQNFENQAEMKLQDLLVQLKDAEVRLNQAIMSGTKVVVPATVESDHEEVENEENDTFFEEPVVEEKPPMPDLSDPNKTMSPDDIAALIANMSSSEPGATPIEEPVIEEPVIEEAVVEEKPPMPDLSDPNKMMSPDDIAALIANL